MGTQHDLLLLDVVPLSLGDSHRGFRVLGTAPDYFKHYKYRQTHGKFLKRIPQVSSPAKAGDPVNTDVIINSRSCGVLDAALESVIGPARRDPVAGHDG